MKPCWRVIALALVLAVSGCAKKDGGAQPQAVGSRPAPAATEPLAEPATPPAPPAPRPTDVIREKATLSEAIEFAKPFMEDTRNEQSKGTLLLAYWAAGKMTWSDLNAVPATRLALVKKDPDEHRGQRVCGDGVMVEIQAEKVDDKLKVFHGGFYMGGQNILRFIAVGSTGDLVEQSYGRFCGIVTGKYDYSNSAGGTAHGIAVVGMFDLPQNRKRVINAAL